MANINVNELYLKVPADEAMLMAEKDGFFSNAFPSVDDDELVRYWFINQSWYDHTYYNDYTITLNS